MNSERIWPQADSYVSLLTEATVERRGDDICRNRLDRGKEFEASWIILGT